MKHIHIPQHLRHAESEKKESKCKCKSTRVFMYVALLLLFIIIIVNASAINTVTKTQQTFNKLLESFQVFQQDLLRQVRMIEFNKTYKERIGYDTDNLTNYIIGSTIANNERRSNSRKDRSKLD